LKRKKGLTLFVPGGIISFLCFANTTLRDLKQDQQDL